MTTEVKKARPVNRLQTFYTLRGYTDEMEKKKVEAGQEGKPFAWCMQEPFAKHFLNAIGIETVYPENYAGICAHEGSAIGFIERAYADGFPSYLCGYLTNTFGYGARMADLDDIPPEASRGGMPKPTLLLMSSSGCDPRTKGFASLARYLGTATYVLESPMPGQREILLPGAYERNVKYLVQTLRDFISFLERLVDRRMDYDKLEEDFEKNKSLDELWSEITDDMRTARPCPMNARDHYGCMTAVFYNAADPERIKAILRDMRAEMQHRIDNGIAGINREEKYRLEFVGLGPWSFMNMLDEWADMGWNVVREGYHPPEPIDLSWVKDPVEKIVRYRHRSLEWTIDKDYEPEEAAEIKKEIMEKGFSYRANPLVADARKYQLDGILNQFPFSCRPASSRGLLNQHELMEAAKIPCLTIEADMIDKRVLNQEELLKRSEAFQETMDYYREVRKKEGLNW